MFPSSNRCTPRFALTLLTLTALVLSGAASASANAQDSDALTQAHNRILSRIDDQHTVTLTGNHHPMAQRQFDQGAVPSDYAMDRMILTLVPDSSQQADDQQGIVLPALFARADDENPW